MEKTGISSPKPAAAPEARAARGATAKPGAVQEGGQAGAVGNGFALLLASLGQGEGEGDSGGAGLLDAMSATTAAEGDAPAPSAGMQDLGVLLPWMATLQSAALPQQPVATTEQHGRLQVQPAAIPAQAAGAAMPAVGMEGVAGRIGLGLVRPGQDSLVGQTALLDGAAEAAALNGTAQADGSAAPMGRAGAARTQPWRGVEAAQGAGDAGRGLGTAHKAAAQASVAGLEQAVMTTAAATQGTGQTASAPGMERPSHAQFANQPPAGAEADPAVPALAAGAMDRATGAGAGAGQQRLGDAPVTGEGGTQGPERSTQQGPDGTTADASQAAWSGAEDGPAEQVTYWLQHKTQNAELTLDRDGRPVDVKVALTGEQAHVSLRSDQLEARQLLDAGREQLHDMLQRQGLHLAGMTVGAGGGDGAGTRQDGRAPDRQGAQRASVQAAAPVAGKTQRGTGLGGRGVDIFV